VLVVDYQSLDIDQPHFDRKPDQAGDIVNTKALHQLGAMGLDGLTTDIQAAGYFLGTVAIGYQA